MAQLTHWKKLINPDYFGSYLFQPKEEKALTINTVVREIVAGTDGKKEECTVIHWMENEKPFILNSTNGKAISKVLGTPYTEEWKGKRIVVGVEMVKAFGEVVEAVRVKNNQAVQTEPKQPEILTCADCKQTIKPQNGFAAHVIADGALKRYGVTLCMDCATKRKTAPTATEANPLDQQPEA